VFSIKTTYQKGDPRKDNDRLFLKMMRITRARNTVNLNGIAKFVR